MSQQFYATYLLYIILLLLQYSSANYFCNLKCDCKMNTACRREPCPCSRLCGSKFKMLALNDTSRQWALDKHNELRNNLALGQDKRGGNSDAANMRVLSYSKEIEFVAQCHANACTEGGVHDGCRRTSVFESVGQNMFEVGSTAPNDYTEQKWIDRSIDAWYEEIDDMNDYVVDKFQSNGKKIGHFTQVVWAETTHIGCGRVTYGEGQVTGMMFYCNYGIAGNLLGASMYIRGSACSKCDSGGCNDKYDGLCGKISPNTADDWVPPFRIAGYAACYTNSWYSLLVPIIAMLCNIDILI